MYLCNKAIRRISKASARIRYAAQAQRNKQKLNFKMEDWVSYNIYRKKVKILEKYKKTEAIWICAFPVRLCVCQWAQLAHWIQHYRSTTTTIESAPARVAAHQQWLYGWHQHVCIQLMKHPIALCQRRRVQFSTRHQLQTPLRHHYCYNKSMMNTRT